MRKFTFLLIAIIGLQSISYAQDSTNVETNDYNRWSIEFSGGVNKPVRPVSSGYYTNTPSFYNVDAGVRYNFTELLGAKLDFGYNSFKGDENSLDFETSLYRFSLQGVVNAGSLLGLRNFSDRVNVLVHGGMGVSVLASDTPVERSFSNGDNMLNFIVGITPQVRLTDRIALTGDLSAVGHVRQDISFSGLPAGTVRGFNGFYVTASIGANIYLGKAQKHADWYSKGNVIEDRVNDIDDRLVKVETDLIDTDQDGVADYLDREPNTISGVAVDTKGIAVDKNGNGIPDELESSLDARFAKVGDVSNTTDVTSGGDVIKKLIDDGYVNVYFKFNSTTPETYSLESINYLIKYMNENTGASAQLVGFADEIGNANTNQTLSEKRATKVKDIMVAAGVAASRLTATGNGEDASVDKASAPARQLVRRVTFKLN